MKMLKKIGIIILVLMVFLMFFEPVRNYMNNLFRKERVASLKEEQVIGPVLRYSDKVREIQQILKNAKFDPGAIDGRMGYMTRQAIKKFQRAKGLKPTGRIDQETMVALNKEKIKNDQKITAKTAESKSQKIKESNRKKINREKSESQDEIIGYGSRSRERIKKIQIALKNLGFYKGEIDGKLGSDTRKAIKEFQKSKGLIVDGIVGTRTWQELSQYFDN